MTAESKKIEPKPIRHLQTPRIQLPVLTQAESFIARRCIDRDDASTEEAFDAPYHFHPEVELLFMETSRGTRYVADSVEPYSPGDLVLIGPNVPHVFVRDMNSGPAASIVVHFRMDFMGEKFFERPEMHGIERLLRRAYSGLHFGTSTARWVAPLLRKLLASHGAERLVRLLDLLDKLTEPTARPLASNAFLQKIREEDFARLNRVLVYTETHYMENISMSVVAKHAGLGPTSFSRWFSGATGKPFVQFLTDIRMAHAYRDLTETGKSITEIAFDCGFNSVSHFIHRFHDQRGVSPREFRRQITSAAATLKPDSTLRRKPCSPD